MSSQLPWMAFSLRRVGTAVVIGFGAIVLPAGAATRLIVTNNQCVLACPGVSPPAPVSVQAGSFFGVLVVAVGDSGIIDPSFRGTVLFTSFDPLASFPASATFDAVNAGVVAIQVEYNTLGSQTITGTDAAGVLQPGSLTLSVFQLSNPCIVDPHTLCLNASRFSVTADYQQTPDGPSFPATAVSLTEDTGMFWFFDPTNVELVVKVLDGCGINAEWWVFAGALTDVGVAMKVTDSYLGTVKSYSNTFGTPFPPIQDSSAFPCP
jgi:hypothetical protein